MVRLQTSEARALQQYLDEEILPDITGVLAARLDRVNTRGGFSKNSTGTKKLEDLFNRIDKVVSEGYQTALDKAKGRLEVIAEHEAEFQIKTAKKAVPGSKLVYPKDRDLDSVVSKRPIYGRTLDKHFESLSTAASEAVKARVNIGLLEGKTSDQIIADIRKNAYPRLFNQADAVARTSVNHVSNHAREATWDANSNEIIGVLYIATLDSRTTIVCASLDGRVFKPDEGPRPPQHYGCRSTTSPVLRNAGGKPSPITFEDWLAEQSPAEQDRALGRTRAKWFREGKVTIRKLVDQSNRPLTIEEIRSHEGLSD